jgi:hypothetical protein
LTYLSEVGGTYYDPEQEGAALDVRSAVKERRGAKQLDCKGEEGGMLDR